MVLPLTKEAHWDILEGTAKEEAQEDTIERISELFGFDVDGEVVEVNRYHLGVGFELTAPNISTGKESVDAFPPYYEDQLSLSYKCTPISINARFRDMVFETFSNQEFRHVFRVSSPVYHKFLSDLEEQEVYIRKISDMRGYKNLDTTTEYVKEIREKNDKVQIRG